MQAKLVSIILFCSPSFCIQDVALQSPPPCVLFGVALQSCPLVYVPYGVFGTLPCKHRQDYGNDSHGATYVICRTNTAGSLPGSSLSVIIVDISISPSTSAGQHANTAMTGEHSTATK
jgi:hypothetical protein